MKTAPSTKTNAARLLDTLGITYEMRTYEVDPDCTGSMVINLNVPGVPPGTSSGVIHTLFVISNGGRHIHDVVSEFTPPGSTGPVPTQTSSDAWKVASDQDQQQ